MASFTDRLKGLFGGKKKRPSAKTGTSSKAGGRGKADRAQVMAEAMAVYRRERGQMQAGLDKQLAKMRADAPKLLRDPEALAKLLTLHKAHVEMRKLMTSDNKRFLVLSGMRELLGDPPTPKGPKKPPTKR